MINKETVKIALKLFVITAVAAFALAFVHIITRDVIVANNKILEEKAQMEVLPTATVFMAGEKPESTNPTVTINSFNTGFDKDGGAVQGYVITATSNTAYAGNIKVMIGVDNSLKVTRVKIMESAETAGLGANASKPKFIDQFIGADSALTVVKGAAAENEISAIASATRTSKAVTDCVNAALDAAKQKHDSGKIEETAKKFEEIKQMTDEQIGGEE